MGAAKWLAGHFVLVRAFVHAGTPLSVDRFEVTSLVFSPWKSWVTNTAPFTQFYLQDHGTFFCISTKFTSQDNRAAMVPSAHG